MFREVHYFLNHVYIYIYNIIYIIIIYTYIYIHIHITSMNHILTTVNMVSVGESMNHQNQWLAFQYIFNRDRVSCLKFRTSGPRHFQPFRCEVLDWQILGGEDPVQVQYLVVLPSPTLHRTGVIPFHTLPNWDEPPTWRLCQKLFEPTRHVPSDMATRADWWQENLQLSRESTGTVETRLRFDFEGCKGCIKKVFLTIKPRSKDHRNGPFFFSEIIELIPFFFQIKEGRRSDLRLHWRGCTKEAGRRCSQRQRRAIVSAPSPIFIAVSACISWT